ncbi:DNA mismatch repair protein Mlh3-like [Antedon mediterranea]|uniref:DNA mismatch repair protein Mlh3-like n=1 Tax=Antedon mediterranea TaxID=105859 RepID=UPI003AF9C2B1
MEVPEIEHLKKDITSRLRSGIAIDSVTQCIDELVTNSIDAGASCIAVRINIGILRFQVVDNGSGLTEDQLSTICERYQTSKCNKLSDLERLEKFGFRGEALASLRDLSSILEIESRTKTSSKTFVRVFSDSNDKVFQGKERASQGTTVTVHSLFHNLPVRQKRIIDTLEVESIRYRLAAIALIHPKISFSLRDDSTNSVILQTRRTGSTKRSFASIFSDKKANCLKEVKYSSGDFSIEGLIGTEGHHNKTLQFMYVNGRLVLKTRFHKLVNSLFGKSLIAAKRSWQMSDKLPQSNTNSPGRTSDQYGIFVLDINCPLADYEITLDPRKTLVEFKDWEIVIKCCSQLINDFLIRENLTMAIEGVTTDSNKAEEVKSSPTSKYDLHKNFAYCSGVERYGKEISTSSCASTLESLKVKRPSTYHVPISELTDIINTKDSPYKTDETENQDSQLEHWKDISSKSISGINPIPDSDLNVVEDHRNVHFTPVNVRTSSKEFFQTSSSQASSSGTETATETIPSPGNDSSQNSSTRYDIDRTKKEERSALSLRANGKQMVKELELLEGDGHPSELPDSCSISSVASVSCNISPSLPPEAPSASKQHNRKTFQQLSGRYLLDDLDKLEGDSQNSIEEKMNSDELSSIKEVHKSPKHMITNYTNSLQLFKQNACCNLSSQPLLTLKLKQQKKTDGTCAETVLPERFLKRGFHEEEEDFVHDSRPTQLAFDKLLMMKKSLKTRHDSRKEDENNSKQVMSLRKLQEYKRKVPHQSIIKNHSSSYDRSSVQQKSVLVNSNQDNENSRFFTPSQSFNFCDKPIVENVTSTKSLQLLQTTHNRPYQISKKVQHGKSNDAQNNNNDFMTSSQFMNTAHKLIGRERNDKKEPECNDTLLIDNDKQQMESVEPMVLEEENSNECIVTKDSQPHSDTNQDSEPFIGRSPKVSFKSGLQTQQSVTIPTKDFEKTSNLKLVDRTEEPFSRPDGKDYMQQDLSDKDIQIIGSTSPICISDSSDSPVYVTGDDMLVCRWNSVDENQSDAVHLEVEDFSASGKTLLTPGESDNQNVIQHISAYSKEEGSHLKNFDNENIINGKVTAEAQSSSSTITTDTNIEQELIFETETDPNAFNPDKSNTTKEPGTENKSSESDPIASAESSTSVHNVVEGNTGWLCHFDQRLGKKVYVNKTSGNSQFVEPVQDDPSSIKDMTKAHRFLTHNATPFLPRTKKQRHTFNPHGITAEDEDAKNTTNTVLENMVDVHLNELEGDVACKWKDPADLSISASSDMGRLMTNCDTGLTHLATKEKDVLNICIGNAKSTAVRVNSAMHQYNFTKEMLSDVEVLGQLDNKFIACLMASQGTSCKPNLLVLVDQHAAHERVRLERLTADNIKNDNDEQIDGLSNTKLKSSSICPPITIPLSSDELRLVRGFRDKFTEIGLQLKSIDEDSVRVSSVPACFVEHDVSEMRHGRKPVADTVVETLIKEQLTLWTQTLGAAGTLPKTVTKVLNSQACHGAIKFGDALTLSACKNLIGDLAHCDLPFQCAHGRPSLMPILDFNLMRSVSDSEPPRKPSLWKLNRTLHCENETLITNDKPD